MEDNNYKEDNDTDIDYNDNRDFDDADLN